MTQRTLVARALAAALLATAAAGCSVSDGSSNESSAQSSGITLDKKAEQQIREAIANAPKHGLKPSLFLKDGKDDGEALLQAGLKYAAALANGYSDPNKLFEVYTIPRSKTDVRAGFQQAVQQGNVGQYIESLAPQTTEYKALSEAFGRYAKLAAQAGGQSIPSDRPIKPGARDARIPAIVTVLRSGGYVPEAAPANGPARPGQQPGSTEPTSYTPQLVAAVKQFQADAGMKPDGVLGKATIEALSSGAADRARLLAVAMERLRWLQRDPPATRIDVNTAAATLDYYRDGRLADHRKVVVGEADKPTPQLQSPLYRLVAKPTWTVPKGIGEKELADKSPEWLAENGFVIKDGLYVQQSGPKNSLGVVKFDLKNDQAIYLHDTPAKALFGLDERHRSHGCVRVDNALQFAAALANEEQVASKFSDAMADPLGEQQFINLPKEIPVRLLYQTAFWDGSRVQFRDDIYGWDVNIAKALGLAPGPPRKIDQPDSSDDIGP